MLTSKIEFKNVVVNGVNTLKRASSIKHVILTRSLPKAIKIPILRNISFTISDGERVGIIGKNGSGKSSILKTIAGIYPQASGSVNVVGNVAPLIEMGVGFDLEVTGRTNIKLAQIYSRRLGDFNKNIEQKIIAFAELEDKIDLPLKVYSSGMQARLAFACALFQNPDILLLDEIFATGDKSFVEKSKVHMIKKLNEVPIAVIINHDSNLIKQICNRCIYVDNGKIIADGNPEEIIAYYESGELEL